MVGSFRDVAIGATRTKAVRGISQFLFRGLAVPAGVGLLVDRECCRCCAHSNPGGSLTEQRFSRAALSGYQSATASPSLCPSSPRRGGRHTAVPSRDFRNTVEYAVQPSAPSLTDTSVGPTISPPTPRCCDAVEPILGPDILVWGTLVLLQARRQPIDRQLASGQCLSPVFSMVRPRLSAWIALTPSTSGERLPPRHPEAPRAACCRLPTFSSPTTCCVAACARWPRLTKNSAVDLVLAPGEASLHEMSLIHGSRANSHGYAPNRLHRSVRHAGGPSACVSHLLASRGNPGTLRYAAPPVARTDEEDPSRRIASICVWESDRSGMRILLVCRSSDIPLGEIPAWASIPRLYPSASAYHLHDLLAQGLAEEGHEVLYRLEGGAGAPRPAVTFVTRSSPEVDVCHTPAALRGSADQIWLSPPVAGNHACSRAT